MPATLDQAFKSPFHHNLNSARTGSSMDSIKNPDYTDFQHNYRVKHISDIITEADELKSVYERSETETFVPASAPVTVSGSTTQPKHDCNYLIAKILSCSHCRNRVKELLADQSAEVSTVGDPSEQQGGGHSQNNILKDFLSSDILTNLILGLVLIFVLDLVLKRG